MGTDLRMIMPEMAQKAEKASEPMAMGFLDIPYPCA